MNQDFTWLVRFLAAARFAARVPNQCSRPADGNVVAPEGREEHPLAGHEAEQDGSIRPGLSWNRKDRGCKGVWHLPKTHQQYYE